MEEQKSLKVLRPLEEFLKHNRRSTLLIGAVITTALLLYSAHLDRQIEIRKHNLQTFYWSMTCDDLPLGADTNVEACEQAIGKFMIEETGLFTRQP